MKTPAGQAMPKYTAQQAVHATKIVSVSPIKGEKGQSEITFADKFYLPAKIATADIATMDGKDPKDGDYYVVALDQTYFQDAAEFEAAWKRAE